MRGVLPSEILDRPKNGFGVPIASWLRGPLRQFTRDHLLGSGSTCNSWLERAEVKRIVEEHERGRIDRSQEIWTLLVFQFWHSEFIDNSANSAQRRRAA
jgi:asparagine synthase (glutamine-hydrolysing)